MDNTEQKRPLFKLVKPDGSVVEDKKEEPSVNSELLEILTDLNNEVLEGRVKNLVLIIEDNKENFCTKFSSVHLAKTLGYLEILKYDILRNSDSDEE